MEQATLRSITGNRKQDKALMSSGSEMDLVSVAAEFNQVPGCCSGRAPEDGGVPLAQRLWALGQRHATVFCHQTTACSD